MPIKRIAAALGVSPSSVFHWTRDVPYTYWGATGDFNLGLAGRSAVDVYKVTLPPPPRPAAAQQSDDD